LADWEHTTGGAFEASSGASGRAFGSKQFTIPLLKSLRELLQEWFPLLVRIFTYYCCIGSETNGVVHGMSYTGFSTFLEESGLILEPHRAGNVEHGRHAKPRDEDGWDLLWVAVNQSISSKGQKEWNANNRLTRAEFIEILVRCAIDDKAVEETSKSTEELCEDMLEILVKLKHVGSILHQTDAFRRMYCYREEVAAMLMHHRKTLRNLFNVYSNASEEANTDAHLMGLDEWTALL